MSQPEDDADRSPDDADRSPDDADRSPDDADRSPDDADRSPDDSNRSLDETHDPVLTVACERCDREWDLSAELDAVGNQAFEQFALDHRQHTGHFPDDVATWRAVCRNCPEDTERLDENAAYRWARTHARHTRHAVEVRNATEDAVDVVGD